jgi:hypothetical protein
MKRYNPYCTDPNHRIVSNKVLQYVFMKTRENRFNNMQYFYMNNIIYSYMCNENLYFPMLKMNKYRLIRFKFFSFLLKNIVLPKNIIDRRSKWLKTNYVCNLFIRDYLGQIYEFDLANRYQGKDTYLSKIESVRTHAFDKCKNFFFD